jgi:catechol 2,3-dioxygenase-like lactoylglutathione lyase family enzyme
MGILHRASALLVSASPLLTSAYTEGDFYIFKRAENTTSLASAWYEHGPRPTIAAKVPDGISWHGNYHYVPEEDGERIVSLLEPQGLLDRRTIDGAGAEPTVFFAKPVSPLPSARPPTL